MKEYYKLTTKETLEEVHSCVDGLHADDASQRPFSKWS